MKMTEIKEFVYPEPPGRNEWSFLQELRLRPVRKPQWRQQVALPSGALSLANGFTLVDEYGVDERLRTATDDLRQFAVENGLPIDGPVTVRLVGKPFEVPESYCLEVTSEGVSLLARDDDGMRRAVYYLEAQLSAQSGPFLPLGKTMRTPWLKNRISRCFFGPIKRPPFNHDELLDDIDYYPDEYLNRLAHEGINGLWLTVVFRELAQTSFTQRDALAEKRLEKLRRTVVKCLRYGIKTWLFSIEPRALEADDSLLKEHPEFGGVRMYDGRLSFCPSSPDAQQYLFETMKDIFTQVPGLGGLINITHGERPTTCLSAVWPTVEAQVPCPRCSKIPKWRILEQSLGAMAAGMREANPQAELISWLYQPQPEPARAAWVYELARHVPEGVILQYNFESGAMRKQLERWRSGGDYWLSFVGPAQAFERMADNTMVCGSRLSAKIQVGCSHEVATVPFVPVPGLLYQKYRAMKDMGCSSVMQCWYFGNYPGVMNQAAGELAYESFGDSMEAFLKRLAEVSWGEDGSRMAEIWNKYTEGYSNYPLSNDMQYYGPMHAGVVWPLLPEISLWPLAPTWKPDFPPSGDTIGECLENHTLTEAWELARRMCAGLDDVQKDVMELREKYAGDVERLKDLGVLRALWLQFSSAREILEFYWQRREMLVQSRIRHDATRALACLQRLRELVDSEICLSREMAVLCRQDSRLGFHSEAEAHQYCVSRLEWRVEQLKGLAPCFERLERELVKGHELPLSDFERQAESYRVGGGWQGTKRTRWKVEYVPGVGVKIVVECQGDYRSDAVQIATWDLCGTRFPWSIRVTRGGKSEFSERAELEGESQPDGWRFAMTLPELDWNGDDGLRPSWLYILREASGSPGGLPNERMNWPWHDEAPRHRLNLGAMQGNYSGRLIYE